MVKITDLNQGLVLQLACFKEMLWFYILKTSLNYGMHPKKQSLIFKIKGNFIKLIYHWYAVLGKCLSQMSYATSEVDIDDLKWFLRKLDRLLTNGSAKWTFLEGNHMT